ncbi:ABC-type antimicrobial peptide transport system, permease component [Chitinophaga rupis]|uniref:ABC-type antimicrobial peptide transport system, permease component n=1 Tax=Chitinophaga rupis TaxID=573321 RepID=A0A1H7SDV4_9BACT|nr:ABC transporter permease [Chitinophaga rupis]SEL70376.1 ABC-type antimicrobial peptide transport system, permease component [Chitinophaga rupis]
MFKNYLLLALRQLRRNRGYSFVNIFGLATGMAIALVIGIWAVDELSIDQHIPNGDRVVEIMQNQWPKGQTSEKTPPSYVGTTVSAALKPWLQNGNYQDVFTHTAMALWAGQHLLVNGDKSIARTGTSAEYTFPLIFGYHFLSGAAGSMRDPNTALISRSTAIALYGTENAVGKTFKYENRRPFIVGGVYADQPTNSSLKDYDFFISIANEETSWVRNTNSFEAHNCRMYALLAGNVTAAQATARIKNICSPFVKYAYENYKVLPFKSLYLHFDDASSIGEGRIVYVRMLGLIGIFILLLACINFMNLATARSEKRAKEVGIRKTAGSLRGHLIAQFLAESVLLAVLSFVLAVALAALTLPWFNQLAGKTMTFPWTNPLFWGLSLICTLLTGLLAGSYPAFYLSAFRPVKVLKGTFKAGKGAGNPRRILVVAQFSISLVLIIGTIVVFRQIQFAKDQPLGYDQAGLITVPDNTHDLDTHYEALRNGLLNTGMVANMANSSANLNGFYQNNFPEWEGMSEEAKTFSFRGIFVNADFGSTIGWKILKGRDFSRAHLSDSTAAIVNETGARILGFKDPIGKTIKYEGKPYTIIGVAKNMISNSPYYPVQPAIFMGEGGHDVFTIRIKPGTPLRTALAAIEPVFKQFNPATPFIYSFVDEEFQKKFNTESRIGNLATVFSALAILISCLGLFGLASFVAEQRTKEIGVRKVLGARVTGLWALLSADFIKLVVFSMLIAMPLSYYCMDQWLQHYALHTSLSAWIFVITGVGLLLLTLATVSYQALRAALMNPIKSLRTE